MLFGKISPQAVIPKMVTPFQQTEIVAEYITAMATPYRLGAHVVDFRVMFGNPVYNSENVVIRYDVIYETYVQLSGQAIEDWGTDDITVLTAIATTEGTTITQFENWFPENFS
jgi:hypothetical protein